MASSCEENPPKRVKKMSQPEEIRHTILHASVPLILKNILSWKVLDWKFEDWVEHLGNPTVDLRLGTKQCTKVKGTEQNW